MSYARYLMVPYKHMGRDLRGWDCYGLYAYVLREKFGKIVGSYTDAYTNDGSKEADASIAAVLRTGERRGWQRVARGSEAEGDGVVFLIGGHPIHCGYVIEPGDMLHSMLGRGTVTESYEKASWTKRIEGFYRWNS